MYDSVWVYDDLVMNYKNLYWLWGADWKFRHEGKCSASRGLPSDAEQLSRVMEFSFRTEQPLSILFLAYSFFDDFSLNTLYMC